MARKYNKSKSRSKKKRNMMGFWYVVTTLSGTALAGLTLSLFLNESGTSIALWKWIVEVSLVLLIYLLIRFGKFTSSESMALSRKR